MNLQMQLTDILQGLLIAVAVLASALYWLRRLAPGLWARLTRTRVPATDRRGACDSGCPACNGCGSAASDARSRESVIRFEHRQQPVGLGGSSRGFGRSRSSQAGQAAGPAPDRGPTAPR